MGGNCKIKLQLFILQFSGQKENYTFCAVQLLKTCYFTNISTAIDVGLVKRLLLAQFYPNSMPLNVQISVGYNILQENQVNKCTTSLSYKPLSKFDYVLFNSNIDSEYKGKTNLIIISCNACLLLGCLVPSFLHRAHQRCTLLMQSF